MTEPETENAELRKKLIAVAEGKRKLTNDLEAALNRRDIAERRTRHLEVLFREHCGEQPTRRSG